MSSKKKSGKYTFYNFTEEEYDIMIRNIKQAYFMIHHMINQLNKQ